MLFFFVWCKIENTIIIHSIISEAPSHIKRLNRNWLKRVISKKIQNHTENVPSPEVCLGREMNRSQTFLVTSWLTFHLLPLINAWFDYPNKSPRWWKTHSCSFCTITYQADVNIFKEHIYYLYSIKQKKMTRKRIKEFVSSFFDKTIDFTLL